MKIKQSSKMRPSISKAILFFGCLFAVINLYGQESALSFGSEPASPAEGPFILKSESNVQATAKPAAQPAAQATTQPEAKSAASNEEKTDKEAYCKNELSIWGAGGFSSLFYDPSFGDHSLGLGGAFGLGYTFYFSRYVGILAGAELALYNAKIKVDGLTDNYDTQDPMDDRDVNFRTKLNNYEEKQQMMNVNVPIALQFQTGGKHKFFASLGFKLGIPVSGKYKITDGYNFETSGYYPEWNQELFEPEYLGYGTFKGNGAKKDIDFNLSYMGTLEAGAKWRLSRVLSLYTGLYFEYGFNDIVDGHSDKFLAYNNTGIENFTVNSTLTSQYTEDRKTESFTDHVSPLALGLKLRLGVNLCKKPKDEKEQEKAPAPTPTPAKREPKPVIIDDQDMEEALPKRLSDEEMEEDLRRAVSEYGSSVRGTLGIELEGYELDQSVLSPRMERILDEKVEQIRRTYGSDISVICEGHTCEVGSDAYNLKLGQKRADIVRNFLISRGFNPNKVVAISKGKTSPIVPNTNEVNRKKNRRVVLIIRD